MRTVYCGDLSISNVGLKVMLCGWVNRYRNFSDFIFIEIRDRSGNVQVCFDACYDDFVFSSARYLRNEFCVQVVGVVRARPVHHINCNMQTGEIEVLASNLKLISTSDPLPLDLNNDNNSEEQRLKYRYLDLRRPIMFQRLKIRSHVTSFVHHFMEKNGFLNIETPMLTRSLPEGARNYLVCSRLHQGKYYALPQSPQLFKQLLMMSGFDRYYQIVRCFRDEDMRSDRQPEFTQIDLETSFMSAKKVREVIESLICALWHEILGVELIQFPQLTYKDVMDRFASDCPDLRNPIEMSYIDISSEQIISNGYCASDIGKNISLKVMIMFVPYGARLSCYELNQYVDNFQRLGGENLTWVKMHGFGCNRNLEGSAVNFFESKILESILLKTCISEQDIVFLSCSHSQFSSNALNFLRVKLGDDLQLIKKGSWFPLWIVDFPMFKKDEQGDIVSMHHVFTAPKNADARVLLECPLSVLADSFDIVINGCELGSGSVRIHSYEIQKIIFKILGFTEEFQNDKFGFLLNALKYGAPIHAGIACGLDRLVMLLSGTENIRDVIAFPKTTNAVDLMMKAPSFLDFDSNI